MKTNLLFFSIVFLYSSISLAEPDLSCRINNSSKTYHPAYFTEGSDNVVTYKNFPLAIRCFTKSILVNEDWETTKKKSVGKRKKIRWYGTKWLNYDPEIQIKNLCTKFLESDTDVRRACNHPKTKIILEELDPNFFADPLKNTNDDPPVVSAP